MLPAGINISDMKKIVLFNLVCLEHSTSCGVGIFHSTKFPVSCFLLSVDQIVEMYVQMLSTQMMILMDHSAQ